MATAPIPFFPTTVVLPPPCGCGATAYAPCRFPPVLAYPSTPFSGGYHPSPFPFYSNPPASPYIATYPYSPPASAYTPTFPAPTAGFSPSWPNWPPHASDSTSSTTFSSPSSSYVGSSASDLPAAAAKEMGKNLVPESTHIPRAATCRTSDHDSCSSPVHHASSPHKDVGKYTTPASRPHAADRTPLRRRSLPQADGLTPACAVTLHLVHQDGHGPLQAMQDGHHEAVPHHGDQASATSERQATNSTSAPKLPSLDGLLTDVFDGTPEVIYSAHSRFSNMCAAASSLEISLGPRFGESFAAPTPGKQGIAPSKCSGHHTPTQSSCLSTISEKNLDAQPQPYGLHNLLRQSVSLADGTKCDYFALPEDYPLQQASPPISPSAEEKYGVMAPLSVAAQAAGLSPFFCSAANNTAGPQPMLVQNLQLMVTAQDTPKVCKEIPVYDIYEEEEVSACLNIFSDMRDFSLELQQQDDQRACKCPVLKAYDSDVTVSTKLWDPGATKLPIMFMTAAGATKLQCKDVYKFAIEHILVVPFGARRASIFESAIMCSYAFRLARTEVNVQQQRDPTLKVLVIHERRKEWHPGEHTFRSPTQNRDIVGVLQTSILTHETTNHLTEFNSMKYLLQAAEIIYPRILSYGFTLRNNNVKCNSWLQSMGDQVECLNPLSLTTPWDPGVVVILHLYTTSHRIVIHPGTSAYLHSSKANLCNQVGAYGISTDLLFTFSGDTVVVDCCNLLTDTIFSTMLLVVVMYYSQGHGVENRETMQWDPGVKISFYTWLDFLTVWSKTDKSLSCTHIPDLASWPNQPVSRAVCIWDPGIGISSPMYHWLPSLTAATEKPLSSLQTPEPATWLSLENNASYAWDPGTILIQNKSVLLLLFTDEKEMVNLIINNTAKNLLSLQNYLQTWEMDIMLITFLPP